MLNINEQDRQVSKYLKEINVKTDIIYLANRENDDEWQCDEWTILFNGEAFTFKTGLGHRVKLNHGKLTPKQREELKELKECISANFAIHEIVQRQLIAVKPTQASVLYCLLLDSTANDESFNTWCDNLGYDNDSIKALNIYKACCDNAEKLNKVFTREQQQKLNELLEDY